jgi:cytochrome c-type biogenesis protein CcsB
MNACRIAIVLALLLTGGAGAQTTAPATAPALRPVASPAVFFEMIDLEPLARVAVNRDGRVKTMESFAREMMAFVSGNRSYEGRSALVTYVDLMLRPEGYEDAEIIFVKRKLVRNRIADALTQSMHEQFETLGLDVDAPDGRARAIADELQVRVQRFRRTGLIAEPMLFDPGVTALLGRMETDVLRGARDVRAIESALAVKRPEFLRDVLRVVPPAGGGFSDRWETLDEVAARGPGAGVEQEVVTSWAAFERAWRAGDATAVSAAAATLGDLLPRINPELYPAGQRLAWESRYFRMRNMTWVWVIYAFALVPLVLHVVFRWEGARLLGLGLFFAAFALHTFAVMLRWYVASRWPNTNMFEAVTTAAWFGGCFALVLEIVLRRSPVRSLLALASSAASMVALMAVHFLPLELNAGIGNRMPVLHDVWLYIHTNVIIFSYCLIFMASISAGLYLVLRVVDKTRGRDGTGDYARVGGAGSLIMTTPEGDSYLGRARASIGQVLDGTTMIVLELAFIMLWAGLVMGAIWADHSWGRPWGWDPKEVFALNTFIIFALLIHVRMKVRDKGLWTAWLAVLGCAVMLFNWIVINFTIAGLHSYA